MTNDEFISRVVPGARQSYFNYGILPSVTIAQACLESGYGASGLTAVSNNLFGIKWTHGCGFDYVLYPTREYQGGQYISVNAKFRKYNSWTDSIVDHGHFLARLSRYKPVLTAQTAKEQCNQLQKCGYATDPNYPQKLMSLIELYNLTQYDTETVNSDDIPTYIFYPGSTHEIDVPAGKIRIIVTEN